MARSSDSSDDTDVNKGKILWKPSRDQRRLIQDALKSDARRVAAERHTRRTMKLGFEFDDELLGLVDDIAPFEVRNNEVGLEPFHLDDERKKGYFDNQGYYVAGKRNFAKEHRAIMKKTFSDVFKRRAMAQDWKCILSMLLDENPMIELTDEDRTNLIRLLSASVKKAVGERIVPATDNRKQYYTKAQKEMMENNRRDVTVSMMKRYPQLLRKFMVDKGKIAPLVDIIPHMNLELYSLKRQEQHFKSVLQLVKEAFFKHGEKDILRRCVKAINFCTTESRGELQDFAQNKLKELEDELIAELKSAMREVAGGDGEYLLLVTLKRLYELQLSGSVPIESLYDEIGSFLHGLSNLDDEVVNFLLLNMYLHVAWCLHSIINSATVSEASLSSLTAKRNSLFEHLEYYLVTLPEDQGEGKGGNQLACRVCTILAEMWCLFRQTNFAPTKLECLGYSPDESTLQKFWKLCEQQLNISVSQLDLKLNADDQLRLVVNALQAKWGVL